MIPAVYSWHNLQYLGDGKSSESRDHVAFSHCTPSSLNTTFRTQSPTRKYVLNEQINSEKSGSYTQMEQINPEITHVHLGPRKLIFYNAEAKADVDH